ncbi:MAG: bifunctional precorrin-2 dehydrogenase/sirohydrochlorin ferrochelatase [Lachnospiraceae bacterium]|jgi:precorrin-2 dehydrogenase/sirohydrochlorin ferrochelatase|nr:bifunctional precorrin-2 dehydrogenase/sirohydrochlorin ferrochelatase [Lachnospiraceae bacterium]
MRFPVFIELEGKKAVVAGAGKIGTRRIRTLADFGTDVLVVSPELSDEVRELWEAGIVNCELREIVKEDIKQAILVVTATDDRSVNHQVALWCREAGIPVNVADKKEECDFYFPGIARVGILTAGVCAEGKAHRLAKEAAAEINRLFSEKYGFIEHSRGEDEWKIRKK